MNSIELHLGDCLEILPMLPDNSVDAVITDPPYGIGKKYNNKKEMANNPKDYWKWFSPIHNECIRILKPGGFWAFYQTTPYLRFMWDWFGVDTRLYIAAKNFVPMKRTPINHGFDPVAIGYKNGEKPLMPDKQRRGLDYFVSNTAGIISDTSRPEREHPSPKPLDGNREIVSNFTLDGGIVFDPFMGSGTTGVACVQTGRNFIGIEIEPKYFEIAEKRIAEAQLQMRLGL